ncbi:glycosyltransferase family 2 protein [Haloarcula marismortui]|uniref:Glycosyl transferase family 2 n=1 Tax=Haloarcula marismortui ATCC 33800 TaxID=662476 RepID=M0K8A2_9EURY|nr:glycosyltransferase [Haloarcula sinaiiensis]EMA16404.1 glycosyl transferase family 2 [Haloarcula sinaiiensis ATCC 33800]QUJ72694.1 glycosyltransferase [Haloarcula sinaiiensis ATCC 33800]
MTLVSAIIPCYNPEPKWLNECVESVINQTHEEMEIILVNDAPDKSIDHVLPSDDRIEVLEHSENMGIPTARNTGIRASNGDYIGLLDQDDRWRPEKVEIQLQVFNRSPKNVGVVYSDVEKIGFSEGKKETGPLPEGRSERIEKLYTDNPPITISSLIKSECFERYGLLDETLYGSDDFELWLRLADEYAFEYIPEVLAIKRVHATNTSGNRRRMMSDRRRNLIKYKKEYDIRSDIFRREMVKTYLLEARHGLKEGELDHSLASLSSALEMSIFDTLSVIKDALA